jgi:site-specific recombinase XerD
VKVIKSWLQEPGNSREWLFTSARGCRLSADAVQGLLVKYHRSACDRCPSLTKKRVTPHVLRHTLAMQLLQSGIDRSVIALWLGHESVETTQIYLDANLALKEQVLAKAAPNGGVWRPFKAKDSLLAFLSSL